MEPTLLSHTQPEPWAARIDAIELLSQALRTYRSLVYETGGFETLFMAVDRVFRDRRPEHRQPSRLAQEVDLIEDLRTIPWALCWAECRLMLPGWYGFGTAVERFAQDAPAERLALLRKMHKE